MFTVPIPGVRSSIYTTRPGSSRGLSDGRVDGTNVEYHSHPMHDLRISGSALLAFSGAIGFSLPSKQEALEGLGQPPRPVGVHSPGHVAATDEKAREEFWPRYLEVLRHVSKTRGFAVPTQASFLSETGPGGALYVGSPETVAQKIAANLTVLGANLFDLKYGMGGLAHETLMRNIELYGTQVIPRVRELMAESIEPTPHAAVS